MVRGQRVTAQNTKQGDGMSVLQQGMVDWEFGLSGIEGLSHWRGVGSPKPLPMSDLAFLISRVIIVTRRHLCND